MFEKILKSNFSKKMIFLSAFLILIGIVNIYFSTQEISMKYGSSMYFLNRHLMSLFIGFLLSLIIFRFKDSLIYGKRQLLYLSIFWVLIIIALFLPAHSGEHRWITISSFAFKPSDFIVIFLVLFLSTNTQQRIKGLLFSIFSIVLTSFLVILSDEIMLSLILFLTSLFILYLNGLNKKWIILITACGIIFFIIKVITSPSLFSRLTYIVNPDVNLLSGYQTMVSKNIISSAKIIGQGLVDVNKLPAFHTHFAFGGFVGSYGYLAGLILVIITMLFVYYGVCYKSNSQASIIIRGLSFYLGLKVLIHIFKCLGFVPANSISYPFISYGLNETISSMLIIAFIIFSDIETKLPNNP